MTEFIDKPVLEVRNIAKYFGGVHALDGVSLSLLPGKVHCLAGENGCGKSTLIKIIAGVERPDSGEIVINGESHEAMTPSSSIAAGLQVIYQDFSLFANLSVAENIVLLDAIAARKRMYSARNERPLAQKIVSELGIDLDLDEEVGNLSIADKQLTAICRALVGQPRVIFMDEPTTALTSSEVKRLFGVVRTLQKRNVAMVFVSHKLNEVLEVADELTILRNGKKVASGPTENFNERSIEFAMTGREIDASRSVSTVAASSPVVLDVDDISRVGYFAHVSFRLRKGEILGLTGLLGSGRGEIAESIFGALPIDSGTISVDGKATCISSIKDAAVAGIGYVPPDRLTQGLFMDKSIADNMIAASLPRYRNKTGLLDKRRMSSAMNDLFVKLRIKAPSANDPVRSLSGGNAQRVVLAKWLARAPKILMLNGPTVGVDVGSKEEILAILREQAAGGMGIIVISDDINELASVCHRILIVKRGEIVDELVGDDLTVEQIQEKVVS